MLIGAGSIGLAIARRIGSGKTILIADYKDENLKVVSKELYNAGFENETIMINISEKGSVNELIEKALSMGNITNLIHSAGVSPSQAQINDILKVDLYGSAVILEEFGKVICENGSGVIISSQSGHRLPALGTETDFLLATTPSSELLNLSVLREETLKDTLHAYQLSKRCNSDRTSVV